MNSKLCTVSLFVVTLFGLGACDSEEETIDGLVDEAIAELNEQVAIVCDCYEELGHASRGDCEDAAGFVGPSRERCVKDAYNGDQEASRQYLECINPLEVEYTTCIDERFTCDDANAVAACNEDYMVGAANCIELPGNIERDLANCFPSQ